MKVGEIIIAVLNGLGMVFNMVGSYKLYREKSVPTDIKYDPETDVTRFDGRNPGYEAISKAIQEANRLTNISNDAAAKWFSLIAFGFGFQLAALLISTMLSSLEAPKEAHNTNANTHQQKDHNKFKN